MSKRGVGDVTFDDVTGFRFRHDGGKENVAVSPEQNGTLRLPRHHVEIHIARCHIGYSFSDHIRIIFFVCVK